MSWFEDNAPDSGIPTQAPATLARKDTPGFYEKHPVIAETALKALTPFAWHPLDSLNEVGKGISKVATGEGTEQFPRAAGLHQALGGAMGIVGPPAAAAIAATADLPAAAAVGAGLGAQYLSRGLLSKAGANPELSDLASDAVGAATGAKIAPTLARGKIASEVPANGKTFSRSKGDPAFMAAPPGMEQALARRFEEMGVKAPPIATLTREIAPNMPTGEALAAIERRSQPRSPESKNAFETFLKTKGMTRGDYGKLSSEEQRPIIGEFGHSGLQSLLGIKPTMVDTSRMGRMQPPEMAPPTAPRIAYRARPVGQEGVPATNSGPQATVSQQEAEQYAGNLEDMTGRPHEVVKVDLSKLPASSVGSVPGPNGNDWIKFAEPVPESAVAPIGARQTSSNITPQPFGGIGDKLSEALG